MMSMWPAVCEKLGIDDAQIIFSAEEPGCGIYVTNDEDLLEKPYVFDGYFEGEDAYMIRFFDSENPDMDYGSVQEDNITRQRLQTIFDNARTVFPQLQSLSQLDRHFKNKKSHFSLHCFKKGELNDM